MLYAKTAADLDRILADLPRPRAAQRPQAQLRPSHRVVAIMGGEDRRGRWRPGRPLRILALMGGVNVDLRDAATDDGVFDIDAVAVMGGVEIIVPDGSDVDLDGFSIMGGRDNKVVAIAGADGPLVRVNGYAVMGGVVIRTATKRERKKYPVEGPPEYEPPAYPAHAAVPPRRKGWTGRIIGLALLAGLALGPGRAAVTADATAIFGGVDIRDGD